MINRFNTSKTISKIIPEGSARSRKRQLRGIATTIIFALATLGCSSNPTIPEGTIGYVGGFLGGVVADEPRASLIGNEILSRGGSAADAVSAMYFVLSVTMPSRAGIGGGGMCVAFDVKTGKTEALDFTAIAPTHVPPSSDRPSAVPGNPRGFFALQARHGNLMWREIIAPAEQLARFGFVTSRAFARDLKSIGPAVLADPGARAMFAGKSGRQVALEGETLKHFDLSTTLSSFRARGVGPFYAGSFARIFVDAVNQAGGSLAIEDMRGFIPKWRDTVRVEVGNEVAHFAPPPAAASTVAAVMLAMLEEDGSYDSGDAGERAHLIAETGLRAFADRSSWLDVNGHSTRSSKDIVAPSQIEHVMKGMRRDQRTPLSALQPKPQNRRESPSSTGFSAVDALGNAVSCTVTMNAAFGTGRVAQGTGVLLASVPNINGRGPIGLAPMLLVNENSKEFRLAATASGGVAAPSALISVVANVVYGEQNIKAAVAQPRVHLSGNPNVTYVEQSVDLKTLNALAKAGHHTQTTPVIGLVNALSCPDGLPTVPDTCQMASDPRGVGLASGTMN
ncbi:MAG: gamma-glutamyltransferase [Magnetovibrio sp.]|nr:gamma-glutamyltransferase [Magnetovibrio sp.]